MKTAILILLICCLASAYTVRWECAACEDQTQGNICYNVTGGPFNQTILPRPFSITNCQWSQTGYYFPMDYKVESCDEGKCNISYVDPAGYSWTCTDSQAYLNMYYVKDLTALYRLSVNDSSATYDWCAGFI